MADFAQQLLTAHPKEAARAFDPLVATARGASRRRRRRRRIRARTSATAASPASSSQAIMFNAFAVDHQRHAAAPGDDADDELWNLLLQGIGTPA